METMELTSKQTVSLAEHFFEFFMAGIAINRKTIMDELIRCKTIYRDRYWKQLCQSVITQVHNDGHHRLAKSLDEVTNVKLEKTKVKQRGAMKRVPVSQQEHSELIAFLEDKKFMAVLATVEIARNIGCRLHEIPQLSLLGNNEVLVSIDHGRGYELTVPYDVYHLIEECLHYLKRPDDTMFDSQEMTMIQRRLSRYSSILWSDRKEKISIHSYRIRRDVNGDII